MNLTENKRAISLATFMGGTIWGHHFDQRLERQTLQMILFKFLIIPLCVVENWEKWEMHYNNKR